MFNKPLILSGGAGVTPVYKIDQSIRFNDDDTAYMHRTPSSSGNRDKWTWSSWIKRGNLTDANATLFQAGDDSQSANYTTILFNGNSGGEPTLKFNSVIGSATKLNLATTQYFRDVSAWYHIVCVYDSGNDVSTERARIYVNGSRVTDLGTTTYPDQNQDSMTNHTVKQSIGRRNQDTSRYMDGYMAEIHLLDGYAYDPSFFGEFNNSGIWIPKNYNGSYGTNGFYIKGQFAGATNAITALGDIQHSTAQNKIGSSSILFDGNGDLLEVGGSSNWYDFGADGNPWTMEAFIRFDTVSITQNIFWQNNTFIGISYVTGSGIKVQLNNGGINFTASFSPSINTWYHLAVVRQTNNTTTVYIDGTSIGSGTISGGSTASYKVEIGARSPSTNEFDGYMDEIRISSVARFTSSFTPTTTEYTADGDTLALIHSNTTNGSTVFKNDVGFGNDSSGNQNNLVTSGLQVHDQVSDSPTNNFPTFNSIYADSTGINNVTLANGNLQGTGTSGQFDHKTATFNLPQSGKWYFEYYLGGLYTGFGICIVGQEGSITGGYGFGALSTSQGFGFQNSIIYNGNSVTTNFGTGNLSAGTILNCAFDVDNDKVFLGLNGTYYAADAGNDGNPSTGANPTVTTSFSLSSNDIILGFYLSSSSGSAYLNFGQEGTFAGNKTAGGNSDANGIGNFFSSVPSGYLALCTKNLGS